MASSKPKPTLTRISEAMDLMKMHGQGPRPQDPYITERYVMANVHAALLNSLCHLYKTAPTVKPRSYDDFVSYCLTFTTMLHEHHQLEETIIFPVLNKAVSLEMIKGEHDTFEKPLRAMEDYLVSCLRPGMTWGLSNKPVPADSPNRTFEATKLIGFVDALAPPLLDHLCQEIGYLDPARLRRDVTREELEKLDVTLQQGLDQIPKGTFVYISLHLHNPALIPGPWFVVKFLIPWVFYWSHWRAWRFAPPRYLWKDHEE